ncbi:MAG: gliding motility lipoprotein GldD [Flavobacterium sp.]|nr:MAG: gliding motility lipoprotein GldD [Flavobacterium sp.]
MISMRFILVLFLVVLFISCEDEVTIKPKAQLSLEYPKHEYEDAKISFPFQFQKNKIAHLVKKRNFSLNLQYPNMKATVYMTYQKVTETNLDSLLRDAQKLAYDHAIKAESIPNHPFVNPDDNVYGMFYMINGNAATQAEFYLTDSIQNFITGALYFEAKPNFDSIYPAVIYLRKDMRRIMETLKWK